MKHLEFKIKIVPSDQNGKYFVQTASKEFIEIKPNEVFDFENFKIFSVKRFGQNEYSDHITGLLIGKFADRQACIKHLTKTGLSEYTNIIRQMIIQYSITPAYTYEMGQEHDENPAFKYAISGS